MTEEHVSYGIFGCQSLSIMSGLSTSLSLRKTAGIVSSSETKLLLSVSVEGKLEWKSENYKRMCNIFLSG